MSDIMNEFNSGGGQSNIRLGDYILRKPDDFGGTITRDVVVGWDGSRFTFDGAGASGMSTFLWRKEKRLYSLDLIVLSMCLFMLLQQLIQQEVI